MAAKNATFWTADRSLGFGVADAVETGTADPGGAAASESDGLTKALLDACSSVPDMSVTDAMMQVEADGTEATEGQASGG